MPDRDFQKSIDSASFEKLEQFSKSFDRQVKATEWIPLGIGEEVEIKRGIFVSCFKNNHVQVPDSISKSFSYLIQQSKRKLKPEYLHLKGQEIRRLRTSLGDDAVTTEVRENMIGYSGDTPVENFHIWNGTQTLIHEATFLYTDELDEEDERTGKHSVLEDVLQAAAGIQLQQLVLGHFSVRYTHQEIDDCIRSCCKHFQIQFPVYRVLPGMYVQDVLAGEPVNANR